MGYKQSILVGLVLAITACSSSYNIAEGDFDYLDVSLIPQLEKTDELELRATSGEYEVPYLASAADSFLGDKVSIRPPAQIIAAAPGSRVEPGLSVSTVFFDAVEGVDNLEELIWAQVVHVVEGLGTNALIDQEKRTVHIPQYRQAIKPSKTPGLIQRTVTKESSHYVVHALDIELKMASHGRSGELTAQVLEPTFYINEQEYDVPMHYARNMEARLLNAVGIEIESAVQMNAITHTDTPLEVMVGSSPSEDASFLIETDFSNIWLRMPDTLQELRFILSDFNQSEGVIYANYEPFGKRRWYHKLAFWKKAPQSDLQVAESTEVVFHIEEVNGFVYITPTIEQQSLPINTLEQWLPYFTEAIQAQ